MAHDQDSLRATLDQIEQFKAESEQSGAAFPDWLDQLASELRTLLGVGVAERRDTLQKMRAAPRVSLDAQAGLDRAAIHVLKR